jgi:GNAT superfamily N-acetyltransferase
VDARIQSYLRSSVGGRRDVERVGPFLATFAPDSEDPFLSYAIPDDGAEPTAADVAALRAAYERRGRVPRLEFLPAVAPGVEPVLLGGGFTVEARLPLMTCAAGSEVDLRPPEGIDLDLAASDADIAAGGAVAHRAFGGVDEPGAIELAHTRRLLDVGAIAMLARDAASGEAVGWGISTPPLDGTTELVGIAVRDTHRRRGIAGAITARLVREAFARGVTTALLSAGDDGAERVYARAGFESRATMLHMRVAA